MYNLNENYSNITSDNNLYERKIRIASVLVELKTKINNIVAKQNAIDIRDIKLYHQLSLEQKHNFYFTPISTLNNSSENNSLSDKSKKNINNSNSKKSKSAEKKKKLTNHNFRIISPFNKEFNCSCKRTHCLKNYCECRKNKEMCDNNCLCEQCKNQY
jgi:hypothetical protein